MIISVPYCFHRIKKPFNAILKQSVFILFCRFRRSKQVINTNRPQTNCKVWVRTRFYHIQITITTKLDIIGEQHSTRLSFSALKLLYADILQIGTQEKRLFAAISPQITSGGSRVQRTATGPAVNNRSEP